MLLSMSCALVRRRRSYPADAPRVFGQVSSWPLVDCPRLTLRGCQRTLAQLMLEVGAWAMEICSPSEIGLATTLQTADHLAKRSVSQHRVPYSVRKAVIDQEEKVSAMAWWVADVTLAANSWDAVFARL